MATFGLKLGIEGEKQFKQALRDINAQLKTVGAEAKMVASQYDANDKSAEAVAARTDVLNKQIEAQRSKLEMLNEALDNAKKTYGENSQEAQRWQQKIYETQTAINGLNRQLEENAKSTADATGAEKEGKDAADKYAKSTKDVGDNAKESGDKLEVLANVAKAAGAAMATAAAAIGAAIVSAGKALAEMTVQGAEYADNVNTQAKVTGIATDKLQEYMYAAELVDVSVETMTGSMTKMVRSMQSARNGTAQYTEAYEALGVSVTDANGELRDSEEVYWELIDALGKIDNETERDALAMTVFGKSAKELNPLIEAGADQMAEYAAQAREAGYVLSGETLDAYNAFDDQLKRLDSGATAAKNALGTILLPVLNDLAGEGVDLLGEFSRGIQDADGDISKMADVLGEVLPKALDAVVIYLPEVVRIAGTIITALADALMDNLPAILAAAEEVLGKLVDFVLENLPELISVAVGLVERIATGIVDKIPVLIEALDAILPQLIKAVISLISGLGKAIVANLPTILAAVNQVVKTVTKAIAENLPEFVGVVLDIVVGIVNAILEALPDILQTIGECIPMVVQALLEALPLIINAVIQLVEAVAQNLPTIINSIVEIIPQLIEDIITAVIQCLPAILQGIITLVKALVQNLPTIILSIVNAIPDLIGNILDAIISCLPDLIQCVVTLVLELIKELPSIIAMIVQQIPSLIGNIVSGIIDQAGKFVEAGAGLLKSVWEGITGAASWLWEKVTGFFGTIGEGIASIFRGSVSDIETEIKTIKADYDDLEERMRKLKEQDAADVAGSFYPVNPMSDDEIMREAILDQIEANSYRPSAREDAERMMDWLPTPTFVVAIGDEAIAVANNNYNGNRGPYLQEGAFVNAP